MDARAERRVCTPVNGWAVGKWICCRAACLVRYSSWEMGSWAHSWKIFIAYFLLVLGGESIEVVCLGRVCSNF